MSIQRVSLEQIMAINDEIAAMARAGIPFERGLQAVAAELPRNEGRLAREIAEQLERGVPLEEVLGRYKNVFPAAYRAVVVAGLRSGHLSVALESLAQCLRRTAQLRDVVSSALVYPLAILAIAYLLFVASFYYYVPPLASGFHQLTDAPTMLARVADELRRTLPYWAPLLPILFVASVLVARRVARNSGMGSAGMRWPFVRRVQQAGSIAVFLEVFALLLRYELPLARSVELSSAASGERAVEKEGQQLARALCGETTLAIDQYHAIPPLLIWQLTTAHSRDQLIAVVTRLAESYRRAAERRAGAMTFYLPVLLSAGLGGTAVVAYAIWILGPWFVLLFRLGRPI